MSIDEIGDIAFQARIYGIICKTERIGDGDEFEYSISFGPRIAFSNGNAAMKFIDAMIIEYKLREGGRSHRLAFGWSQ